ncbi:sigma-70 family RNA polymerase sigma factor [uncultured Proteiniphilum sp.]|uniref:RNA polymerase sigma factor n=1 Tax=uncultured Proteiniphilum sp. TaxID=497637 RepID=UPI002632DF26|nr:sigma-70 family RNA polymerase sigma factor [uncultured Proteiniphilum sp.]
MIQFSNIASTYNEYLDTLYSYALHLGFDEQTAMDAIHDVFYKLCISHKSLSEIENLKFYLTRSLRNRLIDIKRSNKEHTAIAPFEGEEQEKLPFQLNVSIEDEFIEKEDLEEIQQKVENVLSRLTDRQREIVYLRYIREYSYEEIAEIMQISVESSRNLISKSLTKLKESSLSLSLFLLIVR